MSLEDFIQEDQSSKEAVPKDLRIVSIGDSLTQGVGDSTDKGGYIPYLEKHLESLPEVKDASFTNYGVRGNRTDQLLQRLEQKEVIDSIKQADIVVMTIGGNDVMKVFKENITKLDVKEFTKQRKSYEERLHQTIQTVRKHNENAGIVLIGLYNPFIKVFKDVQEVESIMKDWNAASELTLKEYDRTKFVMIEDIFLNQEEDLFYTDQFHPNDRGYELMAERVFESINGKPLEQLTNKKITYVNEGSE